MVVDVKIVLDVSIVIVGISYDFYLGVLGFEYYYCLRNDMYVFECIVEGEIDNSFGNNGVVVLFLDEGVFYSIEVKGNGKIVVLGGVIYGGFMFWLINVYLV